ncbi:peptidoglycan binding protein CsiV [Shewanella mangrovisoli]|uniref:peptidoglycan binding protein CsiV n=1 Tax=Shewanella mangrovisoli TaxID=2864211 RepID=UPI0035B8F30A
MLRQLAVSIATLIALSHSPLARAEAWFEVEVYIFERQSQSTEQWPMAPIETKTNRAIDLISPVVGQAVVSMSNESAPCTLVYDADANSHCAESTSTGTNTDATTEMSNGDALAISGPSTASSNAVTSYRYPSVIPSEIGSSSQAYASQGSGPVLLASSQGQFASIINSLSRERGNRSLLHMTWQQPMTGKSGSVPIRLFAGKDYSASYHFDGRQIVQQAMASSMQGDNGTTGMMTEASAPLMPSPVWQLDGTLNIYLSHYLYIETALNLRKEGRKLMPVAADEASINAAATSTAAAPAKVMTPYLMSIPLEQNRRVKSDEIHYLDHPEMGMVIQIRKMAQPNA